MSAQRVSSLDAFRGLTILGMLLVNNVALGDDTPPQLMHADWSGEVHVADLVFPWFLLIVGLSMPFSYRAAMASEQSFASWAKKSLVRSAKLFALGVFLTSSVYKTPVFSLGVLQLIALAFLVAALLASQSRPRRALVAVGLLALHWAVLRFGQHPEWGAGVWEEGKTVIDYWNKAYLQAWCMRGLWSVVPASGMVLLGSVVGESVHRGFKALLAWGAALSLLGVVLHWDTPWLKPVWTTSYIVFTAGLGVLALAALYLVCDQWKWSLAWPLVAAGANAIFAYAAPIILKVYLLWGWTVPVGAQDLNLQDATLLSLRNVYGPLAGGWVYTLSYIALWTLALCWMYRKRIFWKV